MCISYGLQHSTSTSDSLVHIMLGRIDTTAASFTNKINSLENIKSTKVIHYVCQLVT